MTEESKDDGVSDKIKEYKGMIKKLDGEVDVLMQKLKMIADFITDLEKGKMNGFIKNGKIKEFEKQISKWENKRDEKDMEIRKRRDEIATLKNQLAIVEDEVWNLKLESLGCKVRKGDFKIITEGIGDDKQVFVSFYD